MLSGCGSSRAESSGVMKGLKANGSLRGEKRLGRREDYLGVKSPGGGRAGGVGGRLRN